MSGYGRIDKLPTEINAGWFQLEASYAAYSPAQPSQIISNGRFLVKLGTLPPFDNSGGSVHQHSVVNEQAICIFEHNWLEIFYWQKYIFFQIIKGTKKA